MLVTTLLFCTLVIALIVGTHEHKRLLLDKAIAAKQQDLAALLDSAQFVANVTAVSRKNAVLSKEAFLDLDRRWQSNTLEPEFSAQYLTNQTAIELKRFQQAHPAFAEIFVTDTRGLNIAMTNLTSDFYQADEAWWQSTVARNHPWRGALEYDHSANTWAIPIYYPIKRTNGDLTGIAKAVLDTEKIKPA